MRRVPGKGEQARSAARSALVLALALAWFAMLLPSPAAAQPVSGPIPPPGQPPGQNSQPVMVGLPRLQLDATGALSVEPNVVVGPPGSEPPPPGLNASGKWAQPSAWERMAQRLSLMPTDEELLLTVPSPEVIEGELLAPIYDPVPMHAGPAPAEPIFGRVLRRIHGKDCDCCNDEGWFARLLPTYGPAAAEGGIGRERLAYAPFEIDVAQPLNNFRLRVDLADGFRLPDRAEYFWSKPGRGPLQDRSVDYQDIRILMENGGPKFSIGTEIPIRILDPEFNGNTAGMGDMNLTTKTVMVDGAELQITQIFRTYFNTGASRKGLGAGHISMEPGFLARYRASDDLFWHGALQYWIPIAGDPVHSGQILKYGIGWSHLLYDADSFAIIDTMEFVAWSVLDGQKLDPFTSLPVEIDGEAVVHLYPGMRMVWDTGGDLGLVEFGISGTFGMGGSRWLDELVRMDFRVSY